MTETDLVIACVAAATYLTRFPAIVIGRITRITPRLQKGLNYIPLGVFAGMVAPAIVSGSLTSHGVNLPFLGASAVSLGTAIWTKSPLWAMLSGVVCLALLRLLLRFTI